MQLKCGRAVRGAVVDVAAASTLPASTLSTAAANPGLANRASRAKTGQRGTNGPARTHTHSRPPRADRRPVSYAHQTPPHAIVILGLRSSFWQQLSQLFQSTVEGNHRTSAHQPHAVTGRELRRRLDRLHRIKEDTHSCSKPSLHLWASASAMSTAHHHRHRHHRLTLLQPTFQLFQQSQRPSNYSAPIAGPRLDYDRALHFWSALLAIALLFGLLHLQPSACASRRPSEVLLAATSAPPSSAWSLARCTCRRRLAVDVLLGLFGRARFDRDARLSRCRR